MLMPSTKPCPEEAPSHAGLEEIWLFGLPPLSRLFDFVEDAVEGGDVMSRNELTTQWRAANDYYQQLERSEAGIANRGRHRELDPSLRSLAEEVQAHPYFQRSFDTLPTHFGMVDLAHLIVDQQHVTRTFVDAIGARIGAQPNPETLFRLCLPLDAPQALVQARKVGSRRFVFRSPSTDLRFHEPALLAPGQANGYDSFGALAGIVGLVVGFSSNFLNVVRVGERVLLANGYHRAVAMHAAGITHAPCVVQTASRVDELQVCVKSRIADQAEFYFESARPPLLKDFFDPRIRKLLPVRRRVRQIEVSFEIRDYLVCE